MASHVRSRSAGRVLALATTAALLAVGLLCALLLSSLHVWELFDDPFDGETFRRAAAVHDDAALADQSVAATEDASLIGLTTVEARRVFGAPPRMDGRRWVWDLRLADDYEHPHFVLEFDREGRVVAVTAHTLRAYRD
jgi:hypothetical protein